MKNSVWVKGKRQAATSGYERTSRSKDRVFVLSTKGGKKISYESWQQAMKDGWRKVK